MFRCICLARTGHPDLYAGGNKASSGGGGKLFRSTGNGKFEQLSYTFPECVRADGSGSKENKKAAAWADYDDDGRLDLLIACNGEVPNLLMHNNGDGTFTDKAIEAGMTTSFVTYSVFWFDHARRDSAEHFSTLHARH